MTVQELFGNIVVTFLVLLFLVCIPIIGTRPDRWRDVLVWFVYLGFAVTVLAHTILAVWGLR